MSVNINVTTTGTPAAGKQIADFTNQSAAGLLAMARAAQQASAGTEAVTNKILTNNKALKSAIGGLALNATLFAGPQAQQFIYPLVLMQKELKGLTAAAKLAGVTLPMVGLGVAGITGAVAIGVSWWQKYKAELEAVAAKQAWFDTQRRLANLDAGLLGKNAALDRLPKDEADALKKRLADATPEGFRTEFRKEKVMEWVGGSMGGQGGGRLMEVEREVGHRIETERLADVEKIVKKRLEEVNLTDEQLNQMQTLKDKTEQLHLLTLAGFEKERAAEQVRFDQATKDIEERAKFAKQIDQPALELARMENDLAHKRAVADIDKRQADEKLKALKEFADEQRKLQQEEDEARLKEYEHAQKMREMERERLLARIQSNPFSSDSEKYNQSKAAGADMSNVVDPASYIQQMSAGLAALDSAWKIGRAGAEATLGAIQLGVNGVTEGIMAAISGTAKWGEVFAHIGKQIIASMIQVVIQWIAQQTIIAGLRKIFATEDALMGQTAAMNWREAAYLASVASYGAAAVIGAAALTGGYAASTAAISGISIFGGARAAGGPVTAGVPYLVGEYGPELAVPREHADIISNSKTMQIMSNGRDGGAALIGAATPQVHFAIINDQASLKRWIESTEGQKIIFDVVNNRRIDLGFPT